MTALTRNFSYKNAALAAAIIGLSALSTTLEAKDYHKEDRATVTYVEPIYQTIEHRIPEERCWVETVREEHSQPSNGRSKTPTLVGGIIGGVIGNEVGRGGDNKKIGAVVGSLLGMSIANDIQKRSRHDTQYSNVSYRDVERCEVSHRMETEQVLKGYNVDYRYHGETYSTFMRQHPGDSIRVAVEVRPLSQ